MTTPAMLVIATLVSSATAVAEPITRASEVPELASMALLSVVLAGVSVAVRRSGTRDARAERERRKAAKRDASASR